MKVIIATASHIETNESTKYINMMFDSVIKSSQKVDIEPIFILSISCIQKELYDRITFPKDSIILQQNNKLTQFQHFEEISKYLENSNEKKETTLMVMDDDDLLVEFPNEIKSKKIFAGIHYIIENPKTLIHDNDISYFSENIKNEIWYSANDFSGYTCSLENFIEYFKKNRREYGSLEDIQYMKFIESISEEKKVYEPEKPFIFHRLKETESLWITDTLNLISELTNKIKLKDDKIKNIFKKVLL
jgi:hypothetical protein